MIYHTYPSDKIINIIDKIGENDPGDKLDHML